MNAHDPIASVLLWGTLIFSLAIWGRALARRFNQPGVLGELLMGIVVGNLCYWAGLQLMIVLREGPALFSIMPVLLKGTSLTTALASVIPDSTYANQVLAALTSPNGSEWIKIGYALDIFARYGLIFLLFLVGLENSLKELQHTGRASVQVALLGVIVPIVLAFGAVLFLFPDLNFKAHLFIAATLAATSIGITARVLRELKLLHTREAKTILGAAMIDDILGLIILAIVSGIVVHNQFDIWILAKIIFFAIAFFWLSLQLGAWILQKIMHVLRFLPLTEQKLVTAFIFLMGLSWLATVFQLASIIGAFTAGLIVHDVLFDRGKTTLAEQNRSIAELMAPFELLFAPLFFMLIGFQVKVETFFSWEVMGISLVLIVAAIVGKMVSGMGANKKDDRLFIGLAMVPRGEVGLVFASVGKSIGVINDKLFSAIIVMIVVTTLIAPLALKAQFNRQKHEHSL